MSIVTYTDLQSAIGNWLARSDLSANIPDFITLAEARIFYGADDPNFPSPPLRIRAMEQVTDPTVYLTTAYRRFDPLATTPTNWLMANAPGVYLYAALLEAQPFIMNDQRLPVWASMLGSATRALMMADQQDRWGGQMAMRSDSGNP